jgi:hypothetical protein
MRFIGFALACDGFFHDSPVILGAKTLEKEVVELPIDGLTEINRPPRQGMIRLGIKKKSESSGKMYPAEVDYFILDPETPDTPEKQRLIDLFHKEFGDKPKSISIFLPHSDINEVFPQNYKRYGMNTALKCIGDGLTALCTDPQFAKDLEVVDKDEKRKLPIVKCKGRECLFSVNNEASKNKECKATATLSIEIPVLGGIGVWQITTGSFNSILNINGFIRDMMARFGRAHMLPLVLERREIETIFKGNKAKHYPLYLNTDKSMQEMMKQLAIPAERVLIETYARQMDELPAPEEIMDAQLTLVIDKENKPLMVDHPAVKLPSSDAQSPEKTETAVQSLTAVDDDEKSQEFLKGLKEDAKTLDKPYDKEKEGEGYKKKEEPAPIQSPQGTGIAEKIDSLPDNFFEFMVAAQKLLKEAGKVDMYIDLLHRFGVKGLSEAKDDKGKQDSIMAEAIIVLQEELV